MSGYKGVCACGIVTFQPDKHIWYQDRIKDINDDLPKYKDAPVEQFGSGELLK